VGILTGGRGFLVTGDEWKMACDDEAQASIFGDSEREFQGAKSIRTSSNGRGMTLASSTRLVWCG
jgi:hypothetical protein